MVIRAAFYTAFILFTLSSAAIAQEDRILVDTKLVTVNVTVTDKKGNFVSGLGRQDFAVLDEGIDQPIDVFSAKDASLSIGIVFDMHDADERSASVLEALKRFTGRLGPNDDFFVTVFNEKGSLTAEFVPDADQTRRHLADPPGGSARSLYDAIIEASERTRRLKNAKKYLIVISDGTDRKSEHGIKELRTRLRAMNLPVYALTFTPDDHRRYGYEDVTRNGPRKAFRVGEASELDRSVIAEMSRTTGGASFESSVRNRVYLEALAANFLEDARNQYVLGFYPDTSDGRWRKLKVVVRNGRDRGLEVASRQGYQSSGAKP